MHADPTLDIFQLSRIGGLAEFDGYTLQSHIAHPSGPGVQLVTQCEGERLIFWVPEADWCAWLSPQLAVPSFAGVSDELRPVLASWSLSPLHDFLQAQAIPGCGTADAAPALAPAGDYWRITVRMEERCLPLYLQDTPPAWCKAVLSTLTPNRNQKHIVALGLGWCLLPENKWDNISIGNALPLHGIADTLDQLWLHPASSPGRLRLHKANHATVMDDAIGIVEAPPGTLCLSVEAGQALISAENLARWVPGCPIALHASAHPSLRMVANGKLLALGQLLRLDDGWAVRISGVERQVRNSDQHEKSGFQPSLAHKPLCA